MRTEGGVLVIADAGVNHNGSLDVARRLVDAPANAGADAVKFQTFRAERLVTRDAPKARYQQRATGEAGGQFDMIRALELGEADHLALAAHCAGRSIEFLSTPFDSESLRLLVGRLGMPTIKVSSGDITNAPFLLDVARAAEDVILSTGMSTLADVEAALGVLAFGFTQEADAAPSRAAFEHAYASPAGREALAGRVSLLHCTTEYPAMGMLNATGCTSVWGSTYPFNPYPFPWSNHLFQDSASLAMGVFEGHMAKMAEGFKAVRAAKLELAGQYRQAEHEAFFTYFNWEHFSDEEFLLCPPVVAVGGDGAMYDIGFQNLSRAMMSGKPIKILVVDTQVYSNTGGQACTSGFIGQVSDMAQFGKVQKGKQEVRKEIGLIAMAHRTTYVLQSTIAHANHMIEGFIQGLGGPQALLALPFLIRGESP